MRTRKNKKKWIFYPEDVKKGYWDLWITLVLLISCLTTPFNIAFGDIIEPVEWVVFNWFTDIMFLIDIFVIFNSAYHDSEFKIVEDRKQISENYLKGWFAIDVLAIIPFELLMSQTEEDGTPGS